MYELKNGRSYYYPLLFLRYTYNIPKSFEKSYLKIFLIKYAALTLFSLFVVVGMPSLHLIMSIKDNTGVDISEDISISIGDFGGMLLGILFTLQYKKWAGFFAEITKVKKFNTVTNLETSVRNSNRFSIIFVCYLISGLCLYGAISVSGRSSCMHLNNEKGLQESCSVFHPVWFPFDTNDFFTTITIFTVQIIVLLHLLPATGLACLIILESTEILALHINTLKKGFINLFEETTSQEISAKLRDYINYHNDILRLGRRFNRLQKYTSGHLSFITAIVIGSILNQMKSAKPLGALIYLLGYTIGIAIICHAGQRIIDESTSIREAVFASNWYKGNPQTKRDLAFIILNCQKPIYLNCFPLGIYNYALFATILKTSYSYLTLIEGAT